MPKGSSWLFWAGVGFFAFGVLVITGIVVVFPVCSGFSVTCLNPLSWVGGTLNMVLGIAATAAGLILVLRMRRR